MCVHIHVLQPKAQMDCYEFVKRNFSVLNGKIYRPYPEANYLVLAELKTEPKEHKVKKLWERAKVTQGNAEETDTYKKVRNEMEEYFAISDVEICAEGGFEFERLPEQGNLKEKEEKAERNVLACNIGIDTSYYANTINGTLEEFVLIGTHSYGLSDLRYFVPFTNKGIQGYYQIDNVVPFIGKKEGKAELRLRLKLSQKVSLGEWKKTDTGLRHPELFTLKEILNIYDTGILFLPRKNAHDNI